MATTTTITKILFRRGNDADRVKTILASGEPGFALDTGRIFIGDGATPGGLPIIKPAEFHLRYVDDTGVPEGDFSRHSLDINVPGLSATLAGDRTEPEHYNQTPKLFHPTDRTLLTTFPIELTGDNDSDSVPSINFTGDGVTGSNPGQVFKIDRTSGGLINIGDVMVIDTNDNSFSINAPGGFSVLGAAEQTFADGDATVFEDRSIDFNVPVDPQGERILPGNFQAQNITVENTGIYFTHMGVMSAGMIGQGSSRDFVGWNTINLRPAVYQNDWLGGNPNLKNRFAGNITVLDQPPMPRLALEDNNKFGAGSRTESTQWQGASQMLTEDGNTAILYNGNVEQFVPKNIKIRSVRPGVFKSAYTSRYIDASDVNLDSRFFKIPASARVRDNAWDGDVDLVFETGLIVYGPGDPDIQPDKNGYLINQSVDSLAAPTFQGLRIEGPNAKPLGVESGGTGNDSFTPKRMLKTSSLTEIDPFEELALNWQQVIVGKGGEPVPGTISITSEWWTRTHDGAGNIKFTSQFQPDNVTAPGFYNNQFGSARKQMFFDKFVRVECDTGTANATRFDSRLLLSGDLTNMSTEMTASLTQSGKSAIVSGGTTSWDAGLGPRQGIKFNHVEHAVDGGIWARGSGSGDIRTAIAGVGGLGSATDTRTGASVNAGGHVMSAITFNKGGHVRDVQTKNLDNRFAQVFYVGNKSKRPGGNINSPSDIVMDIDAITNPLAGKRTTARNWFTNIETSHNANVISTLQFNDYGTVRSVGAQDLANVFYNKSEMANIIDNLAKTVDTIHYRLDNDFIVRRNVTRTNGTKYSDTNVEQGVDVNFLNQSSIHFGKNSSKQTTLRQYNGYFEINGAEDLRLYSTDDIRIQCRDRLDTFADTHNIYNNEGTNILRFNDNGILLAANKKLTGYATNADDADKVLIRENDTDNWYSLNFADNNSVSTSYSSVYKDNFLEYNPGKNWLRAGKFEGDGELLDMSKNPTIPSSIELETAADLTYNIVMSTNARDKIYDKNNTLSIDASSGTLYARGDVIAFRSFSDENLKKNVENLDSKSSLEKVLKLQGVTYEWKDAPGNGTNIGLIAQQVEKVVPEVVGESPRVDDMSKVYKRVEYDKIVPLLIESVKELTDTVNTLKAEIAELKKN